MLTMVYKDRYKRYQNPRVRKLICSKIIVLLSPVLLTLTAHTQASFTTDIRDICLLSHSSFSKIQKQDMVKVPESADTKLVNIGTEIAKPYTASATSISSQREYIKSLPAAPPTILMVLIGFLCISLVRDRRAWLTILSSLLWVGQGGIYAVPLLAKHLRLATCTSQNLDTGAVNFYLLENIDRARCDIEGTRYIGLLNYLTGIPNSKGSSHSLFQPNPANILAQRKDDFGHSQPAINKLLFLIIRTIRSLVPITEFSIYLKPISIFQAFPRGPPDVASGLFYRSNTR